MVARWTRLTGWLIAVIGSGIAVFLIVDATTSSVQPYWIIVSYPIAFSLILAGTGVLLARGNLIADRFLSRLLAWMVTGIMALALLTAYLYFLAIDFAGNDLLDTPVGIITIHIFGALVGLLIGSYDARAIERKQDIERSELELAAHNERLDNFASVVSHDLRNPLMVILGQVELMRESDTSEHLDQLAQAGNRMEEIIEDLLALSRGGHTVDTWEMIELSTVARESWANVATSGSGFDLRVPDTTTIEADPARLMNVFENLYRNATEHNNPPVTIRVGVIETAMALSEGESLAGFFVEDDGDGIDPGQRDAIFDQEYTTKPNGTGLGLAIVKEIIEAHNWTASVTNSAQGGARFEIRTTDRSHRS